MNPDALSQDSAIGLIYEAAAGRAPWELAMHAIATSLGLLLAQVIGVDMSARRVIFSFEGGSGSAEATLDYTRKYHSVDPHVEHLAKLGLGEYVSFSEVLPQEVIEHHPFYRDYLVPYGGRHVHAAKVYQNGDRAVMLGLHRGLGSHPLSGDDAVLAGRLISHLVRAFDMFMALPLNFAEAAIGQAVLERLSSPVLLVDGRRRVVLRNSLADQLLMERRALTLDEQGVLRCRTPASDAELGLQLKALQLAGHPGLERSEPLDRTVFAIPMRARLRPMVAVLMALRPQSSMGAFGSIPLAMVVLHDSNKPAMLDPFAVASAFDFTPAEARVAVQLAAGHAPAQISESHGVSVNTVNTHVRAIHAKLGVNKTAEVVSLLLALPFVAQASRADARTLPGPGGGH